MGDVTSLSAATTYVTIASGLVTATGTGTPNQRVPCTAIATSGEPARA